MYYGSKNPKKYVDGDGTFNFKKPISKNLIMPNFRRLHLLSKNFVPGRYVELYEEGYSNFLEL